MIALVLISLHCCWFAGADSTGADPTGDESTGSDITAAESTGTDSIGADPFDDDSIGADPFGDDSTGIDSNSAHSAGANSTGADSTSADSTGADSPVHMHSPKISTSWEKIAQIYLLLFASLLFRSSITDDRNWDIKILRYWDTEMASVQYAGDYGQ